ncbi:MAG: hypothetical protein FWE05_04360 [Defluviitaleaceae bacterium]|nr:hypothetical protein [Defluviitaleaceae bacterium]
MFKILYIILILLTAFSLNTPAYGADLPIDITAIGREGNLHPQFGHHFSTNLFTEDAMRVNAARAEQVNRRQETSYDLFSNIPFAYEVDMFEHLTNTGYHLALFSAPRDFSHINIPLEGETLSTWIIVFTLGVCAIAGFVLAMVMKTKKKGQSADVY